MSEDGGLNWQFPCERLGSGRHEGFFPSLAYDADNIPYVAYRTCGNNPDCPADQDGVRMAWLDQAEGRWWTFVVHEDPAGRSGHHTQIVVDPITKEPTIAFVNLTRGSAVIAQGRFH